MNDGESSYRRYVEDRLKSLVPIFARASVGDFPKTIDIPDDDDEFTDLFTGVQVMLDVIRRQLDELRELNRSLESRVGERTAELEAAERLAHLGRWEWNIAENSVHWSDELYRLFGLTPGETPLTYESYLDLLPPEDRELGASTVGNALRTKEPFDFDHRIIGKDGSTRWVRGRGAVVTDAAGNPVRLVGTAQDITGQKAYEAEIRKSEERYRGLFQNARDVIFTLAPDGTILSLNPSFETITGWPLEEFIGKSFTTLIHPEDLPAAVARFRRVVSGEILPAHEWRIRARAGHFILSEMVTTPQVIDGRVAGLLGIARDITERKRAEEKFRGLLESAPDAMVIVDGVGAINLVNTQTVRLFGYGADELLGKTIEMLLPESLHSRHMEHRGKFFAEPHARPMGAGLELHGRRKDGSEFPVEVSLSPMESHGERLVTAAIRDITDRKRVEEQIRLLAHTVTSMNECIAITDTSRIVEFVNPSFIETYGIVGSEVIGSDIARLFPPGDRGGIGEIIEATAAGGWRGEVRLIGPGGAPFPALLSTSVLHDPKGDPVSFLWLTTDLTTQKRLQGEVEEITRQRAADSARFAASVQSAQEEERRRISRELHDDIGQRLTGLKFNMEIFEETLRKGDAKTLRKLRQFKKQVGTVVNDIRRISSNLHPAALDDFGLMVAIQLFCREFEEVHRIGTEFQSSDPQMTRYAPGVEVALYRITQEAFVNIAKHASAKRVVIRLDRVDGVLRFSITDDGKGFDPRLLRGKPDAGRGLGLISMKERAEYAGGTFEIVSQPGGGTSIRVELPVPR